jgi:hypothetical protein
VTEGPLAPWHALSGDFKKVAAKISAATSVNINSATLREEVQSVARNYMQTARSVLSDESFSEEQKYLDDSFSKLYELAEGKNKTATYKRRTNAIKKALPRISSRLEMQGPAKSDLPLRTAIEIQIAETLNGLVPTAGLSYQQAIRDLADNSRVSFRGPASELREVLREVLDHQAPDSDVVAAEGYKPEKDQNGNDRSKPTMKQKVRFILKARDEGSSAAALPEKAVEAVDALVGGLARSVYNFGSVVTHVAGERQAVVNLKRYVEVVLTHLLEL